MYVAASSTTEVNDLRYHLFLRGWVPVLLPPCRCCLFRHLIRANYQAAIWKCCLHARPTVPDPTKCGWIDDDGKLTIHCLVMVGLQVCPFLQAAKMYAWQIDEHAQIYASYSSAVIRNDRQMKTIASNVRRWYRSAVRCLTLMFDHYVWTAFERSYRIHPRACCRPAVNRNRRKMTASNSMI